MNKNPKAFIDLTGRTFGALEVLSRVPNSENRGETKWLCRCSCGVEKKIVGASLRRGLTVTCGCGITRYKGYKDLSGVFWKNIKGSAKKRDIEFGLTIQQAWRKLVKQNFKCALTGIDLKINKRYKFNSKNNTASLDRIDSSKGYVMKNVQWLHKDVNRMKWDLSQDRFLEICRLCVNFERAKQ